VNAEAIIQKYWRAVDDLTNYQQDVLSDDAIRLALSLAVQDAFAAGAALADDRNTACGGKYWLEDGTPDQHYKFCPSCGHPFVVRSFIQEVQP